MTIALVAALALASVAPVALAQAPAADATPSARAAIDRAAAAMAAQPPRRDEARAALASVLAAGGDPSDLAEAHTMLGRLDEDELKFPQAVDEDRAALVAAPDSRWAVRASERLEWLRARSEGGFAPLVELERVRHDPALSSSPAALDTLARDADGFAPGMVRIEAWMLVSEAWLGRMNRPGDAIDELRKVTALTRGDPLTLRLAEEELVNALATEGRIDEALAEATAHSSRLDPKFLRRIKRLHLRRAVLRGADAVLGVFVLCVLVALARAARRGALPAVWRGVRGFAPAAAFFVAVVALVGGGLARSYESGTAAPFFVLAGGAIPVVLLSRAWSAIGSDRRWARVARAILGGSAALAATFTLLEAFNPRYLDGFGL